MLWGSLGKYQLSRRDPTDKSVLIISVDAQTGDWVPAAPVSADLTRRIATMLAQLASAFAGGEPSEGPDIQTGLGQLFSSYGPAALAPLEAAVRARAIPSEMLIPAFAAVADAAKSDEPAWGVRFLSQALEWDQPAARYAAAEAMQRIPGREAKHILHRRLQAETNRTVKAALRAASQ
jgi:hypothetical protein